MIQNDKHELTSEESLVLKNISSKPIRSNFSFNLILAYILFALSPILFLFASDYALDNWRLRVISMCILFVACLARREHDLRVREQIIAKISSMKHNETKSEKELLEEQKVKTEAILNKLVKK